MCCCDGVLADRPYFQENANEVETRRRRRLRLSSSFPLAAPTATIFDIPKNFNGSHVHHSSTYCAFYCVRAALLIRKNSLPVVESSCNVSIRYWGQSQDMYTSVATTVAAMLGRLVTQVWPQGWFLLSRKTCLLRVPLDCPGCRPLQNLSYTKHNDGLPLHESWTLGVPLTLLSPLKGMLP